VTPEDAVRAHLPDGSRFRGLSLYRVVGGRISETRHALIDSLPV
jgi:hypothetical protein